MFICNNIRGGSGPGGEGTVAERLPSRSRLVPAAVCWSLESRGRIQRRARNLARGLDLCFLFKRQVLMNKGDRHASLTYSTGYALDRVVAHIAGAKNSRQTRLQGKGRALEFPAGEITAGADVAFLVTLQLPG